jgi:hypothetical protein
MTNPNLKYFGYYFAGSFGIAGIADVDRVKKNMDMCEDHCNLVMIQVGDIALNIELMDYAIAKGLKIILVSNHIYTIGPDYKPKLYQITKGSSVNLVENDDRLKDYIVANSHHFFGIYFLDEPFFSQHLTAKKINRDYWLCADMINQLYAKLQYYFDSIPQMAPFSYDTMAALNSDSGADKSRRLINNLEFEYASVSGAYINANFGNFSDVHNYYTTLRRLWIDEAVDRFKSNRRIFVTGDAVRATDQYPDKDRFENHLIQRSAELFNVCKNDDSVIAYIPFMFPSSYNPISGSLEQDGVETLPSLLNEFKKIGKEITGK